MTSAPAWSIGGSKRSSDWRTGGAPGPGAYNARLSHRPQSPSWKMGSSTRSVDKRDQVPGPGAYNSPGKISTTAPRYSLALKTSQSVDNFAPGPGTYNATGLRGYDNKPPSYTFRAKTPLPQGNERVPGPGAYDQSSRILNQKVTNVRIGSATRDDFYPTSAAPGPGTYSTRPTSAYNKESGPKYGFGSEKRDPLATMSKTMPGPGQYTFKGEFESPGKGTSMVPRRPDSAIVNASRSPGPGAYNPTLDNKNKQPAYRIGSASRDTLSRERIGTPGPGNYDLRPSSSGKNVRIGTSVRQPLNGANTTPGPGSYEHRAKVGEGPKYVINPRRDDVARSQHQRYTPGPGAYTPSVELTKMHNSTIGFGTSNRTGLYSTKANPGPGQYDTRRGLGGPRWGFGSEQRGKEYTTRGGVPGPGQYNIPSKIADVPKYAYGNAPLKIHL